MEKKKPDIYKPLAPYAKMKKTENAIKQVDSLESLQPVMRRFGSQIGYKAFCYLFMEKMTPEAMKPDEAVAVAAELEVQGNYAEAREIYKRVVDVHVDHPVAKSKMEDPTDRFISQLFMSAKSLPNGDST